MFTQCSRDLETCHTPLAMEEGDDTDRIDSNSQAHPLHGSDPAFGGNNQCGLRRDFRAGTHMAQSSAEWFLHYISRRISYVFSSRATGYRCAVVRQPTQDSRGISAHPAPGCCADAGVVLWPSCSLFVE